MLLVFFVGKKDGSKQMMMDYCILNSQTVKNNYVGRQPEIIQTTWQGLHHLAFPQILGVRSLQFPSLQFRSPSQVLHNYIWQCSYYCLDAHGYGDQRTDRLVQYKQLVVYGRIPYLNNSLSSWATHRSNLRHLLYYTAV